MVQATAMRLQETGASDDRSLPGRAPTRLELHEVILDSVAHGLCVYGPDLRLELFNRRFLEVFDVPDGIVHIGMHLYDVLAMGVVRGTHGYQTIEKVWCDRQALLATGRPFQLYQHRANGAVIDVHYRPAPGGRWVATHEDVTAPVRLQDELQAQATLLGQVIGSMSHGLAMFGPDERLVVCNPQYTEVLGLDANAVRPGMSLVELTNHVMERGLYEGQSFDDLYSDARMRLVDGGHRDFIRQLADGRYISTRSRPVGSSGWVVTCEDVTARERAGLDLREQHRRFDAALNNMSNGLCMFDASQRLIVCNDGYVSIFRADPDVVKPGVTLREIFVHGVGLGLYPGMTADQLTERRIDAISRGESQFYDTRLGDGRIIEVATRPLADGGWIGIFEDVTERRRIEAERAEAIAEAREKNVLMDATLDAMAQGLCVFDPDFRVIVMNRRYLEIYGLDPQVARPGVPMIELIRHSVARGVHSEGRDAEAVHADFVSRLIDNKEPVVHRHLADGRVIAVRVRAMAEGGWVATFEDITERERAAGELREQHRRFDAALNNMAHGLVMLDENLNLIVCNRRYLEMYRMSPDVVRPGTSMMEIVRHSLAQGNYNNVTAEHLVEGYFERLRARDYVSQRQLADGRVFSVVYEPMPHGGWVAVHEDITERRKAEQHIAHMAHHDALTGLPNRVLLRERMSDWLAGSAETGEPLAVLCLDLDHFKGVNDTLGHPVGDQLLTVVAGRLGEAVGPTGLIARLGGDEFAIVLPATSAEAAGVLARRLVRLMAEPFVIDGHLLNTGLSIGIAMAPCDGMATDHLMKCADLALYRAKSEGRGMYRFFEPDMSARIEARRALELSLREALGRDEFRVVFQPQVCAQSGSLRGFEALLRWNQRERGPVSPAEFVPLAEETGLIHTLGTWVLRQACRTARHWPAGVRLAVNLSPVQFKNRGLVAQIMAILEETGLDPRRLELEITEQVLLQNDDATIAMLHALRNHGIRIAMDDFGVGYSSLSYLRSFPFDKIKIDRSFIADIDQSKDNAAIIRAIAGLGSSIGVATTAEGVEAEEQLAIIRACGCTEVQGYLISPPRTEADALAFIQAGSTGAA
ncbi:PAS-domain containing protein [Phreatobacter sp.]|uniref:PAS-domain containing protein n=1 Tax=Phreatobacter sp. TaxID=1966341 RepID=UPI003F701A56